MEMTHNKVYHTRKQFFNDNAERWRDMWYKNTETGNYDKHKKNFERLFSLLPLKRGDHVLDVGCGSGVLAPFILERITETGILYELDFAEKMIAANRSLHEEKNIQFVIADVENAPLDDASCNAVICFSCFPHFHNKAKAVMTSSRILKPHGVFVVSHFNSSDGTNKHHASCRAVMHDHLPDRFAMRSLFEKSNLHIETFLDERDFYLIIANKCQ